MADNTETTAADAPESAPAAVPEAVEALPVHSPGHFRELETILDDIAALRKGGFNLEAIHGNLGKLQEIKSQVKLLVSALERYIQAEHQAAERVLRQTP